MLQQCIGCYITDMIIAISPLQSITKFESLANQVQKNAGDIEERLKMIESVRLFKKPPPRPGADIMDAKVA